MGKNKDVLNAQEAADFLGAYVETIRRLARKGEIPAYKIGKDWRFQRDALMKWAETHYMRHKQPCVLVIDDEQSIRKLISHLLEAQGYQVLLASDGDEGLLHLDRKAVDLIMLDLNMPKMNGAEFLRQCRKANPDLPVIVVTGYPDSDLMAEAMLYGPITLIAKPIDREHIIQAVRVALGGARQT